MFAQTRNEGSVNMLYCFKWTLAAFVSLWGTIPVTVQSLFVLMCIDFTAGWLLAKKENRSCPEVARNGLIDKTLVILLITAAYWVCKAANLTINIGSGLAVPFCFTEFHSIARNCRKGGLNIPTAVLELLESARRPKRKKTK